MIEMVGVAVDAPRVTVAHCSLLVRSGEIVAVVGAANSGKSLILDVLVGRRRSSRGASQVLGFDPVDHADQVRRHVTHIPPAGLLDQSMTLRQQLNWWASLLQVSADTAALRRAMRQVEIPDRFFDVSGAAAPPECRVQLWLSLAVLRGHHVLLIDDPVRFTSMSAARHLTRVLSDLAKSGACVLITTRDAAFADRTAKSVVALENGRTQPLLSSRSSISSNQLGV